MLATIKDCYRQSWRFVVALPLLVLIPVAAEFAQHIVEFRLGMFDSAEAARAAADAPERMAFGYVKVLALLVLGLWVPRFIAFDGDRAKTLATDSDVLRMYGLVMLLNLCVAAIQLSSGAAAGAAGLAERPAMFAGVGVGLVTFVLGFYFMCWSIAAALGDRRVTIPRSFGLMRGNFWWSLAFSTLVILPPMAVHYALNMLATGQPDAIVWTLLTADALFVGLLGTVITASGYFIYRRALDRAAMPRVAALTA